MKFIKLGLFSFNFIILIKLFAIKKIFKSTNKAKEKNFLKGNYFSKYLIQ